jgi:two-component system response regulator AtoC
VRIICATNRHLWDHVKVGRFREDLYYRIACLAVRLPPLRERLDDIEPLASSLLEPISRAMSRRLSLTTAALDQLKQFDYPGNVRELRNILSIAAAHCKGGEIDAATVIEVMQEHKQTRAQPCPSRDMDDVAAVAPAPDVAASLHDVEAQHINRLLQQHSGNRKLVAASLGVSERTLYRKLKRYALA